MNPSMSQRLTEVAMLFLKQGFTAFGGPAAHIAMMHDETVNRRKWLSDQDFLDLLGATNLIPGPNSTQMAIHLGYVRAGWAGLVVAGTCFIAPAMLIVLLLSWLYMRYGATPQAESLLYGVKPAVISIIAQALWNLGPKAVKGPLTAVAGIFVLAFCLGGVNIIALLFAGGIIVMLTGNFQRLRRPSLGISLVPLSGAGALAQIALPFSLPLLFLTFLKIGAVLYGSEYVLLAFLRADFVVGLGWLNDKQLIDAIAIGQVTPGPVFTTATFVGFILGGIPGALVATLGIFLPSFIFVAISNPLISRVRNSVWLSGFMDGVNVASLGLTAAVTWQLGRSSLVDPICILFALVSLFLLIHFKVNTTWVIVGGAIVGISSSMFQ